MVEAQFPPQLSRGAKSIPTFDTTVIALPNGKEQRVKNRSTSRRRYDASHLLKDDTAIAALYAFFLAIGGMYESFLWKDWRDYNATGQSLGTGDGSTATFQLKKAYTSPAGNTSRIIEKPVNGTVKIYVATVLKTESTDYTVNYTTGVVTFLGGHIPGIGAAVTADFQFNVPVRLDVDEMEMTLRSYGVTDWDQFQLIEVVGE